MVLKNIVLFVFSLSIAVNAQEHAAAGHTEASNRATDSKSGGIHFSCDSEAAYTKLQKDMDELFKAFGWESNVVQLEKKPESRVVNYRLAKSNGSTLNLSEREDLKIKDEEIETGQNSEDREGVVSKKEIVAAMLTPGRTHTFSGKSCSVNALLEHVGIRQSISYWSAQKCLTFPEGESAKFNKDFWNTKNMTLKPGVSLSSALTDIFEGKFNTKLGCTTAGKVIFLNGYPDFFRHVARDLDALERFEKYMGNDPLADLEPELGDNNEVIKPGKIVERHFNVPVENWVPGDWGYIKNRDPKSASETGYEGSNILYKGGGRFGGYYDTARNRTLDEYLARVYNWGHGHDDKASVEDKTILQDLRKDPSESPRGQLRIVRDVPRSLDLGRKNIPDYLAALKKNHSLNSQDTQYVALEPPASSPAQEQASQKSQTVSTTRPSSISNTEINAVTNAEAPTSAMETTTPVQESHFVSVNTPLPTSAIEPSREVINRVLETDTESAANQGSPSDELSETSGTSETPAHSRTRRARIDRRATIATHAQRGTIPLPTGTPDHMPQFGESDNQETRRGTISAQTNASGAVREPQKTLLKPNLMLFREAFDEAYEQYRRFWYLLNADRKNETARQNLISSSNFVSAQFSMLLNANADLENHKELDEYIKDLTIRTNLSRRLHEIDPTNVEKAGRYVDFSNRLQHAKECKQKVSDTHIRDFTQKRVTEMEEGIAKMEAQIKNRTQSYSPPQQTVQRSQTSAATQRTSTRSGRRWQDESMEETRAAIERINQRLGISQNNSSSRERTLEEIRSIQRQIVRP